MIVSVDQLMVMVMLVLLLLLLMMSMRAEKPILVVLVGQR